MSLVRPMAAVALLALLGGCDAEPVTPAPTHCPAATIHGVLEPLGSEGLGVFGDDSRHVEVDWPDGYRAINVGGRLSLVDPGGHVIAVSGSPVRIRGGEIRPGTWVACGEPFVESIVSG